jgi:acyl-CoA synthetase (AMP-forming)/AMP-acid ligase II
VRQITPNLFEIYGSVGAGPISVLRPQDLAEHADSIGRPAPTWEIEIVDDEDRALTPSESGRLRLRGPGLAAGVYSGSSGTSVAEGFRDGWYYTGDIAAFDAGGFLHLKGRASDVILRGGSNIYPDEIEAVLAEHPAVTAAGVVGRPAPELGEEVVAFVVADAAVDREQLLTHCRTRLTSYKIPAEIILVTELPMTSFGKVDRRQLRSRAERP